MKMQSVSDLMVTGLTYVLDFEEKVSQEASKMAEASSNPELKEMFEKSVTKGREYAQKVEQTLGKLGQEPKKNDNPIAKAMIEEVENMIGNTDKSAVRDAALLVAANQMQHYRIAVYGSMAHYAELIGKTDVVEGLKQNLEDSKGGDEKLTRIGEEKVNPEAAHAAAAA
jgi:ferritin-like metal-binding protein YciE